VEKSASKHGDKTITKLVLFAPEKTLTMFTLLTIRTMGCNWAKIIRIIFQHNWQS